MIRPLEENDISSCLEIYNWYIENSVATFEETKLSLSQFQQRVHRICEKYPYIVLEEGYISKMVNIFLYCTNIRTVTMIQ